MDTSRGNNGNAKRSQKSVLTNITETRNRFEPLQINSGDDEQGIENTTNKSTIALQNRCQRLENTVDTTRDGNNAEDGEHDKPYVQP